MISKVLIFIFISVQISGCDKSSRSSAQEEAIVLEAVQAYVKGWLSNEADAVMASLTDDIILQPHHGDDPVIGSAAVREWWFPEEPVTVITAFTLETEDVTVYDSVAYAWGRSNVKWDYEGSSYSVEGNALSVLKKGKDGIWRIAHQIWNDPVPDVQ